MASKKTFELTSGHPLSGSNTGSTTSSVDELHNLPLQFSGYPLPTANTTYVPNQFFDVLLRHSSRGCLRLVSYLLRKTLGWCDEHGNPREQVFAVSHRELSKAAGISRGALKSSIDEAIAKHYIQQLIKGQAAKKDCSHTTAAFSLCWSNNPQYTTDPKQFLGFFSGEGNRTYVPNAFFDHTVRYESLAVVKTIGAVIRHTIGFQNQYGFRRQQVQKSYKDLERITGLSPRHLSKALAEATQKNHICVIEEGYFDKNAGRNSRSSTYGLRWLEKSGTNWMAGEITTLPKERSKKDGGKTRTGPKRIADKQLKKDSGCGSNWLAEKRPKKDSDIEIKQEIKPIKTKRARPAAVPPLAGGEKTDNNSRTDLSNSQGSGVSGGGDAAVVFERLMKEGFNEKTARKLVKEFPAEQILKQCILLEQRSPSQNRLGMLRRAITENWDPPASANHKEPTRPRVPLYQPITTPTHSRNLGPELERKLKKLQTHSPALYQSYQQKEKTERAKIEQMPLVSSAVVQKVLAAFDAPESRLRRLAEFSESQRPNDLGMKTRQSKTSRQKGNG